MLPRSNINYRIVNFLRFFAIFCGMRIMMSCVAAQEEDVRFTGCDPEVEYYSSLSGDVAGYLTWTRDELEALLFSSHRNRLPYTDSDVEDDDVWKALIDLDVGTTVDTVWLSYANRSMPALPHGTSTTWNREHLWPSSRGVGDNGFDFTDVHHLRPADWNLNSVRNKKYLGDCQTMDAWVPRTDDTGLGDCDAPAHSEASSDTARNSVVFLPPEFLRGDIARALFYMDVRYSAANNNGDDLVLTDCPDHRTIDDEEDAFGEPNIRHMAYLSQLLQWHLDDPVSDAERNRNSRVCERWQGNRNPFVDFPDLAQSWFGLPQPEPYDCSTTATTPTITTTPTTTNNDNNNNNNGSNNESCDEDKSKSLEPGDVLVVAVLSDNPDTVALVSLVDIAPGTNLYLTDNAYVNTNNNEQQPFLSNEGSLVLAVTDARPIAAGTVFGFRSTSDDEANPNDNDDLLYQNDWVPSDLGFSLAATGDNIHLYAETPTATTDTAMTTRNGCSSNSDTASDQATAITTERTFLWSFSFNGPWLDGNSAGDTPTTASSAIPASLAENQAYTALDHRDNYVYAGPMTGTKQELRASVHDTSNWLGTNDDTSTSSTSEQGTTLVSLLRSSFVVKPSAGVRTLGWSPQTVVTIMLVLMVVPSMLRMDIA